jgi:hypothetical protein
MGAATWFQKSASKHNNTYRIFIEQKFFDNLLSESIIDGILQELKFISVRVDDGWDIF